VVPGGRRTSEKLAVAASNAIAKATLKEMASTWLRLAESSEKKDARNSGKPG
jgi:hypothetical protein